MAEMTFTINDQSTGGGTPVVQVYIRENADGTVTIRLTQLVASMNYLGDLRGFFMDLTNEGLLGTLAVSGSTMTLANGSVVSTTSAWTYGNDSVATVGSNSNNMNGMLGSDRGFDFGIEIGSEGVGAKGDDVRGYEFTLGSSSGAITLADFAGVNFGIRITSVGLDTNGDGIIDTARNGSVKMLEQSVATTGPNAIVRVDDDVFNGGAGGIGDQPDAQGTTGILSHTYAAGTVVLTGIDFPVGLNLSVVTLTPTLIVIAQNGTNVLQIQITNAATGAYQVTQLAPMLHPTAGNENDILFTIGYDAVSSDGDSASGVLTIDVNDDSVLFLASSDLSGSVTENGTLVTTGHVDFKAADGATAAVDSSQTTLSYTPEGGPSAPLPAALDAAAIKAAFSITNPATGAWSFDGSALNLDPLASGDTITLTYKIVVTDADGDAATETVTVTVIGTNDGPVANPDAGTTSENAAVTVDVLANDTDADVGHTLTVVSAAAPAGKGSASIVGNQVQFNPGTDFDHLAQGATETVVVNYTIQDEHGAPSSSTLTIIVTGTNDGPVANPDTAAGTENQTVLVNVLANDTDLDDGHVFTLTSATAPAGKGSASVVGNQLQFNPGTDFDHLADGATELVVVNYSMADEHGATSSSTVTVTVTGTNDTPVAHADTNGLDGVSESGVNPGNTSFAGDPSASGNVLANDTDVDDGAVLTVKDVNGSTTNVGNAVGGVYGSVTISADGNWVYTLDNSDVDTQKLYQDQTVTETFNYSVKDNHGATSTSTLTITIIGTNDAPIAVPDVASATEAGGVANGTVGSDPSGNVLTNDTDVDAGDSKAVAAADTGERTGSYGTLTLAADGSYSYVLDNDNPLVEALRTSGQTLSDVFTYTVVDAAGASSSSSLTIIIHGANDAPVAVVDVADATEAGGTANGTAGVDPSGNVLTNDTDADSVANGETKAVAAADTGERLGTYGTLTLAADGSYSYALDNDNPVVEALLGSTDTLTDSFTYTVVDAAGATSSSTLTITVHGADDAPVITSGNGDTATASVAENSTAVTTVTATDVDSLTITFSIAGGDDAALFAIDPVTGALSFIAAPDFESPADADLDNVYQVIVQASDGTLVDTQAIEVSVTNVNEAPVITSGGGGTTASASVAENSTAVTTVVATDVDAGTTITYSIVGGADSALFTIDSITGALSFIAAPDFENPADDGANNVYDVSVQASDGSLTDTQAISVTVTDVNEAPVITSNGGGDAGTASVAENGTSVTTVTATDQDAGAILTFSIVGGDDSALFTIDSNSGALSFISAPDFETPGDADSDNVYDVIVQASDGTLVDTQAISVTVTDVNEAPVITSDGGGDTATASVAENGTAVTTVTANDPDAGAILTFSIVGGADQALFTIDPDSGALSFISAPDFEAPADDGADNVYEVTVQASDGSLVDSQAISVTVTDVNEAPVITSGGGGDTATASVAENSTAVTTVMATDQDAATTLTFSIAGGDDAALFTIDPDSGALSFVSAPNFEAPADFDGDNVYDVVVQASDGSLTDTQAIAVTVTDVNEAPVITSDGGGATATASVAENGTAVTTVTATDPDAGAILSFSIVGGADQALFTIDANTGALSFITAPDFENPADAGADNVYDVVVQASDGSLADTQAIAVTVTDVNEAPVITSDGGGDTATASVAENSTAVTTVTATDQDAGAILTFSIVGGADSALFQIDPDSGALSFIAAPNFEAPADVGGNNVYDVVVEASDGDLVDTQSIAVTVSNVNEAPVITSNGGGDTATAGVAENSTTVTTVVATDVDAATTITFSIVGGADAALFMIDSSSGALSFITAPDYEVPTDAGGNNVYDVTVRASDGSLSDDQAIGVTVDNLNDNPPIITSNGGGASAGVSVAENMTTVTTVTATDADGDAVTFAITGGADAAKFAIDSTTGALTFVAAPDFESPTDAGGNNVYDVEVTASDGVHVDTQTIAVTVTNQNDNAPVITSDGGGATASVSIAENTTAVTDVNATDADGDTLTYSISGGADSALFQIDATTGVLSFIAAPDFEAPTDAGANNIYDVEVSASDGLHSDTQSLAVTVTNVNDNTPVITSNGGGASASISIAENTTGVADVNATDADGDTLTYSISGGADAAKFAIDPTTGVLSFIAAPDYENPQDAGANNVYDVEVTASDGLHSDTQSLAVTVTNVNDNAPVITSNGGGASANISIAENTTAVADVDATDADGNTLTYSIVGGADALKFAIDPNTGVLTFVAAPDYESPTDAGGNNVYDVVVQASDGLNVDTQSLAVTVTNVNDNAPVITSNGGNGTASVNVPENSTAVTTVTATDADGNPVAFSITGGADAAKFAIDVNTGVLTFVSASNFEIPTDAGANNVYDVVVTASDGTNVDTQAIAVTVTNVNEAPTITSDGGGATASVNVAENTGAVTTVVAGDVDAATIITYSIVGGADAAKFTIDGSSGALSFVAPPNFENPTDAGTDNVYDVVVQASDGSLVDTQSIAVTVTDVNAQPVITSNGAGATASVNVAENTTGVATVVAVDDGENSNTLIYSIVGGADAPFFTINASTGALAFAIPPNFEDPHDAGLNGVYDVVVQASDGTLVDTQALAVTVTNANDAPVLVGGDSRSVSVAEGATAVTTVVADDEDAATTITYSIVGGADAAKFTISSSSGALSFVTAPNFEGPTDSGANNVYDVIVQASDGSLVDTQAIAVTVTNQPPVIDSNGGGATASVNVAENTTGVATVHATDPATGTITYSIAGGADAAKFTIDPTTGVLSFVSAPDFETPTDAGGNNIYDVTVRAADSSGLFDDQAIAVTVTDVTESGVITNLALGSPIIIPEYALLYTSNPAAPDIAGVSSPVGGTVTHTPGAGTLGNVTFTDSAPAGGSFAYTTTTSITTIVGVSQDIVGTIDGTSANDILISANGGATLQGNAGNDVLLGGGGNDTYLFGLNDGSDVITDGGSGGDKIVIITSPPTDSMSIPNLNFERTSLNLAINVGSTLIVVRDQYAGTGAQIEQVSFSNGGSVFGYALSTNSYVISTDTTSPLNEGGGSDIIASSSGTETLNGGSGNDLLFGNGGNDTINGEAGNDLIMGGDGGDIIDGGNDNDTIVGQGGADTVTGGSGTDTFVLTDAATFDTITDYAVGEVIDITTLLTTAGPVSGFVRFTAAGDIEVDANGGGDGYIKVAHINTGALTATVTYSTGPGTTATVVLTKGAPPVGIDMDGDGQVSFLATDAGASFDYGYGKVATAWVGGNDGILVRDVNHDGQASATEIVFATSGSDLQGLAAYDSNHDGQLSSADSGFADFQVWQDANSDGSVDAGEMHSLTALGIASISLSSDGIGYSAAGGDVQVVGTGSYTRADGSTGVLADAVFATGGAAASQEQQGKVSASANSMVLAAAVAAAGLAASAPAAAVASASGEAHAAPHLFDAPLSGGLELSPAAASAVAKLQVAEQMGLSSDHQTQAVSDSFRGGAGVQPFHAQLDNGAGHSGVEALLASTAMPTVHDSIVSATPFAAPSVAVPSAEQLGALVAAAHDGAQHNQVVGQVLADALHGGGQAGPEIDALLNGLPGHATTFDAPLADHGDGLAMAAAMLQQAAMDHAGINIGLVHPDAAPPA